jgi:methionyl aminopeptidase
MESDIPLKTSIDVAHIRRSCRIAAAVLERIENEIVDGISTEQIDTVCRETITSFSARPAHLNYRGFPCGSSVSVNHVAAHGIPGDYRLVDGDLVTVDLSVVYNGWFGDMAMTYIVGRGNPDGRRTLKAAKAATDAGIRAARAGSRLGDIGIAMQHTVKRYGCNILPNFVGHGIGRELHEEPMVLNEGEPGTGLPIVPGMVFTIEPIVVAGGTDTKTLADGWTVVTSDGSLCAQFEHTVAIFGNRTEILTMPGIVLSHLSDSN